MSSDGSSYSGDWKNGEKQGRVNKLLTISIKAHIKALTETFVLDLLAIIRGMDISSLICKY